MRSPSTLVGAAAGASAAGASATGAATGAAIGASGAGDSAAGAGASLAAPSSSPMMQIGSPTSISSPGWPMIFVSLPAISAAYSTTALSVSSSQITSPTFTSAPSSTVQRFITA